MAKRFTRGVVTLAGTLLGFGTAGLMLAGSAGASVNTSNTAGYMAGNGHWNFRYVASTILVPENACGSDDFVASGVELSGTLSSASVAVACNNGAPEVFWGMTSLNQVANGGLNVHGDDLIKLSLYYNQTTGYDNFYAHDLTTGATDVWAHKAGVAQYIHAAAATVVNNPLLYPPSPGTSYILVKNTSTEVTSTNGTHGAGINGPWGAAQRMQAMNGAHVIANAPNLFENGQGFDVRVYGNS